MSSEVVAGWRRARLVVPATAVLAALAAAGCGEKPEPAVHPPTTAATTTTPPPTATVATTPRKPTPTPTAPVPKTTP